MTMWIMLLVSSLNEYRKNLNYNNAPIELSKDFGDKKGTISAISNYSIESGCRKSTDCKNKDIA